MGAISYWNCPYPLSHSKLIIVPDTRGKTVDNKTENTPDPIAEAIARQVSTASNTARREVQNEAISAITNALQDRIDEGSDLDKELAHDIFKAFCEYFKYYSDNPFKTKYKVSVKYGYYNTLFSVEIEAEDEDEARKEVEENLSLSNVKVSGTIEYSGDDDTESGDFEDHEDDNAIDIDDLDLNFEVEELD